MSSQDRSDPALDVSAPAPRGTASVDAAPEAPVSERWPPLTTGAVVAGRYRITGRVELGDALLLVADDLELGSRPVALVPAEGVEPNAVAERWHAGAPGLAALAEVVRVRGGCLGVATLPRDRVAFDQVTQLSRDQLAALLLDLVETIRWISERDEAASPGAPALRVAMPGALFVGGSSERPTLHAVPVRVATSQAEAVRDDLESAARLLLRALFGIPRVDPARLDEQLAMVPDALRAIVIPWLQRASAPLHTGVLVQALGVDPHSSRVPVPVAGAPTTSTVADGWQIRARRSTRRAWVEAAALTVALLALGTLLLATAFGGVSEAERAARLERELSTLAATTAVEGPYPGPGPAERALEARPGAEDPFAAIRAVAPTERVPRSSWPASLLRGAHQPSGPEVYVGHSLPPDLRLFGSLWGVPVEPGERGLVEPGVHWVARADAGGSERARFRVLDLTGRSLAELVWIRRDAERMEGEFRLPGGRSAARVTFDAGRRTLTLSTAWGESMLGGCAAWRTDVDRNGFLSDVSCLDGQGRVTAHRDGWERLLFQRDADGRAVRLDSVAPVTGALRSTADGWATVVFERDARGRELRRQYQSADGTPVDSIAFGASTVVHRWQGSDAEWVVQLLDAAGHATRGTEGWHEARWSVGAGERIWSLYDPTGRTIGFEWGRFAPLTVYRLDPGARVVERASFASTTRPALDPVWRHHRTVFLRDARGRPILECDFDPVGPMASDRLLGAFCMRSTWRERADELSARALLNVYDGTPLQTPMGREAGAQFVRGRTGRYLVRRHAPSGATSGDAERSEVSEEVFRFEGAELDPLRTRLPVWDPRVALEGAAEYLVIPRPY